MMMMIIIIIIIIVTFVMISLINGEFIPGNAFLHQ